MSATLAQTGLAPAENWTFGDGFVERLRYEIDPQWKGNPSHPSHRARRNGDDDRRGRRFEGGRNLA